ncbi:MAG: class I tRNA ligase family protein, partial [Parcubacteria group bacterium]
MSDFKKVQSNQNFPEMENEVIKFWEENKIFEKSLESRKGSKEYAFYDGPPFATGTPHYGHLVGSIMKDVVPRYWTMRGYYVERKWGWDCHGLPIENIVEKELGSKKKKDIEVMGVDKFNELCRSKVLFYVDEWKKVIKRLGRWADMENPYKTMDLDYMESVWWVFKELYDKDLIYEGYRSMHICTRCETTLSQQEVAEGYQDIKDLSAIAKFELLSTNYESDTNVRITDDEKTYILAWTTTPWTLIGNVALAVGEDVDYCKVKSQNSKVKSATENLKLKKGESYILAKDRLGEILKDEEYEIVEEFKGKDLVGKEYKPLFDYYQGKGLDNEENGWKIYPADFVTTEEGTGVVHIAPAFGEDDLRLGEKYKLPFVQHVGLDGVIKDEAKDFAGLSVKPSFAEASAGKKEKDSHQKTDIEVIKYLAHNNLLFAKEKYEHSYPHCWRCDTPLINYATSSWFVAVEKIKEKALELAKEINWSPSHMKKGRFGNWLEGARDWSISRQRFWASVMPIWVCDKCGEKKVIGSVEEIREQFGSPNKFFLVRHGEAEVNVKRILNSDIKNNHYHLTEKGKVQIMKIAKELRDKKIDMIFSSPFLRTKETAEIISERLGVEISFDERLKEFGIGNFEGKKMDDFLSTFPDWPEEGDNKRKNFGIESESDARKRFEDFIDEINK